VGWDRRKSVTWTNHQLLAFFEYNMTSHKTARCAKKASRSLLPKLPVSSVNVVNHDQSLRVCVGAKFCVGVRTWKLQQQNLVWLNGMEPVTLQIVTILWSPEDYPNWLQLILRKRFKLTLFTVQRTKEFQRPRTTPVFGIVRFYHFHLLRKRYFASPR